MTKQVSVVGHAKVIRSLVVGVLGTWLVLGGIGSAAALDYVEPTVPVQLQRGAPPATLPVTGQSATDSARLQGQGQGLTPSAVNIAPGPALGSGWSHEVARDTILSGKCAIWDWNAC